VYETMTATRPYHRPKSPVKAREELVRCAGTQFDPAVVNAFLQVSVRRLRLVSGPGAWLAQTPPLRGLRGIATAARRTTSAAAVLVVAAVMSVSGTPSPVSGARPAPAARDAGVSAGHAPAATSGTTLEDFLLRFDAES
jgi:hypothetical protein